MAGSSGKMQRGKEEKPQHLTFWVLYITAPQTRAVSSGCRGRPQEEIQEEVQRDVGIYTGKPPYADGHSHQKAE